MRTVILGPTGPGIRTANIAATGPTGLWEVCGQTATGRTGLFKTVQPSASPDSRFKSLIIPGYTGGGGGGYVAGAVHFDGTFWAAITALVTADSPLLSFSGWALIAIDPRPIGSGDVTFFDFDPNTTSGLGFGLGGALISRSVSAGLTSTLVATSNQGAWVFNTVWKHVFGYSDCNHAQGVKVIKIFLDTVDVTGTVQDVGAAFSMPFHGNKFAIEDDPNLNNHNWAADFSDWMFYPGQLITDITIFRDQITGKPKNPATFPQGAIMLSGNADTFLNNTLGTEGPLAIQASSLTNAPTSPSD